MPSPPSIDTQSSPLSQSTTDVSATPHVDADDDIPPPTKVPLMVSVNSETGDQILTMGSPKKRKAESPEEPQSDALSTGSGGLGAGLDSPGKGHKPQKSGGVDGKPHKRKSSKKKGGHKPQKSGGKVGGHKPQKSTDKAGGKGAKKKSAKSGKGQKKKSDKAKH